MPNHIPLPPIKRLNELLEIKPIDPSQFEIQSGLVWKVDRGGTARAGSVAGSKVPNSKAPGRFDWKVKVDGRHYFVSRVIYFMANGEDPGELTVDHEDWNPMNNNVWNLRLGDDSLQSHSRAPRKDNKSGAVGVTRRKNGKWQAKLTHKGEHFHLGCYTCKIEAARVLNNKAIELELDKIGKPLHDLEALKCGCGKCL
jgi:hypothetical protein